MVTSVENKTFQFICAEPTCEAQFEATHKRKVLDSDINYLELLEDGIVVGVTWGGDIDTFCANCFNTLPEEV